MTTAERLRATVRPAPATLVERLADALESAGIAYCQWKGHSKRNRWMTGAGDLDLLVDAAAWPALVEVLLQLGFKRAVAPPWLQLPGVDSYLGYDQPGGPLVHVHTYHRIVIGLPWRTTYAVPLAQTVLAGATPSFVVRAPAPEHELLLVLLQAAQRSTVRDIVQRGRSDWIAATRRELQRLEPRAEWSELVATIERDLPSVSVRLFERCLDAFLSDASRWRICVIGRALTWGLRPFARRPALGATPRAIAAGLALRRARRGRDRRALSHPRELRALRTERGAGRPDDARHRARAPAAPGRVDVLRVDATPGRDDRAAARPGARREPQDRRAGGLRAGARP